MIEADLDRVLSWRNDESIRSSMFSQAIITMSEHRQWFFRCEQDKKKHCLIFSYEDVDSGFVSFELTGDGAAEWGFYLAPGSTKGLGKKLGKCALEYAFQTLNLVKVIGKVIDYNTNSIKFHEAMGFNKDKHLQDKFFDGKKSHTVFPVCY